MFVPQQVGSKRSPSGRKIPVGIQAFDSGDCHELLEKLVARGNDTVVVIESETGDLRDCRFVYKNEAFNILTASRVEGGSAVRSTILDEFFNDPETLRRVYDAVESGARASEEHVTRSLDGYLRLLQIDIIGLSTSASEIPRWLVVIKDITEQSNGLKLHEMLASARCMVWHALVESLDGDLIWTMRVLNEEGAKMWLPIPIVNDEHNFAGSWPRSWLPGEGDRMHARSQAALWGGETSYRQEFRCRIDDGSVRWIAEDVQIDSRGPGRWRLVGVCTDITETKKIEEAFKRSEQRLSLHVEHTPLAVIEWDVNFHVTDWNPSAERIFGYTREQAIGRHAAGLILPDGACEPANALWRSLLSRGDDIVTENITRDGRTIICQWYNTPLVDESGEVMGGASLVLDITEKKAMDTERETMLSEALERADRDPLTGLLNHRSFHKRVQEETDWATRNGSSLAIAFMDMDNFKFFNDAYGYTVGDAVLNKVATALRECCRSHDVLARFGGDEFALLMPDTTAEEATLIADRLTECLDGVGYTPPDYNTMIPLSLSLGLAVFPDDGRTRLEMLTVADDRLLRAKSGDSGGEIFTDELKSRLSNGFAHFSMLNALVSAVDNKDRYTRRHSEDVLTYSMDIARELDFDDTGLFYIQVAALLHDVGKIGVPDAVLRKPGRLTEEEFSAIKQHPMMGAIMVGAVPGFEPILDAVRHHHERWDGKGYPDCLAGRDIPITARLMAVADAFSAMTTDRPYRKGMDPVVALKVLEDGAGTQWDPECVEIFLRVRRAILRNSGCADVSSSVGDCPLVTK